MGFLSVQGCRQPRTLVFYQVMYSINVLALLTESDGDILAHQCSVHMDAIWYSCFTIYTIYTHRSMGHYSPSPPTAVHAVPSYLPASPSVLENFRVIFRMLSKLQHIYICVSDH